MINLVWLAMRRSRVEIVDDGFAVQLSSVSAGRIFPPPGRVAPAPAPVVSPGIVGTGLPPPPVSSSSSPVVGARRPSAPIVGTWAPASPATSSISSISSSVPDRNYNYKEIPAGEASVTYLPLVVGRPMYMPGVGV